MEKEREEGDRLRKMLLELRQLDDQELLTLIKGAQRLYDCRETAELLADSYVLFG